MAELYGKFEFDVIRGKDKLEFEAVEMPSNVRHEMLEKVKELKGLEVYRVGFSYVSKYITKITGIELDLQSDDLPFNLKVAIWSAYFKAEAKLYEQDEAKN